MAACIGACKGSSRGRYIFLGFTYQDEFLVLSFKSHKPILIQNLVSNLNYCRKRIGFYKIKNYDAYNQFIILIYLNKLFFKNTIFQCSRLSINASRDSLKTFLCFFFKQGGRFIFFV